MSQPPPELIDIDKRIIDIPFGNDKTATEEPHIQRSQRLPLPYHILSLTWFPAWTVSITKAWMEIYISDSHKETPDSIQAKTNILKEVGQVERLYAHSWYHHPPIELNRLVEKEPYIYARIGEKDVYNGMWTLVKVML